MREGKTEREGGGEGGGGGGGGRSPITQPTNEEVKAANHPTAATNQNVGIHNYSVRNTPTVDLMVSSQAQSIAANKGMTGGL